MSLHEPQQIDPRALGPKAFRGGRLLAAGTLVDRLARLGRNMLLARIIVPEDFALMAITLVVIALFTAITEVGVAQAVIQNKHGFSSGFLNVAWWFGVVRGLIVAVMGVLLAAPIARFYDKPDLEPLLLVAPLIVVFTGLTSPRVYALQRKFRFGATLWTTQGAGLLGTALTIVLGMLWQNVWALVVGAVFEAFARFVLSFIICPIRPRLRLERESTRALLRFSRGMAGLPLMGLLIMQADVFVLGKVIPDYELGLYTLAIALAAFPLTLFSKVVQPLVVPMLATLQDDNPGMQARVLQLSRLVWMFGLPLTTVMSIASVPLLSLVYGPQFTAAAPAFSLYSAFCITYMASMVTFSVYLAIARPSLQRRITLVRAAIVVVALYPLSTLWGGSGAALTLLIAMVLASAVQLANLRNVIGLQVTAYLATLRPGLLASVAVAVPAALVVFVASIPGWADVILCAMLGAATWVVLLFRDRRVIKQLLSAGASKSPMRDATVEEQP